MQAGTSSKKNPMIAGVLSIIPGLGQLYNEQIGKGILILGVFLASLLIFIVGPIPFLIHSNFGWDGVGFHRTPFLFRPFLLPLNPDFYTRFYPVLWIFLILPMLVIYSIVDAMVTAKKMKHEPAKISPSGSTPAESPSQTTQTTNFAQEQEVLRMQAQEKMSGQPSSTTGSPTANVENAAQKHSVKFLVGLILLGFGFIYYFELWEYPFFNFDHLWPLIPLVFGLRLLADYMRDRDHGQLILGAMFTGVGSVFFAENWMNIHLWYWISRNWPIGVIIIGSILIVQDFSERKKRTNR